LVFDGRKNAPYVESDPVAPLNVYGESKARAERAVLRLFPEAMVVRTSAFFGLWDEHNFVTKALRALAAGEPFFAAQDCIVSPTYVPDLVQQSLDLLIDRERGIVHLANDGALSWHELALRAAEMAKISTATLVATTTEELRLPAARPFNSALSSERMLIMPTLEDALERYVRDSEVVLQCTRGSLAA
jgi:dTDP-4-dehydrorhamnose reductase